MCLNHLHTIMCWRTPLLSNFHPRWKYFHPVRRDMTDCLITVKDNEWALSLCLSCVDWGTGKKTEKLIALLRRALLGEMSHVSFTHIYLPWRRRLGTVEEWSNEQDVEESTSNWSETWCSENVSFLNDRPNDQDRSPLRYQPSPETWGIREDLCLV